MLNLNPTCKWQNCYQTFENQKYLSLHVHKIHTYDLNCGWEDCQYTCKRRSQMLSHFAVHVSYFPFDCMYCQKSFKRKYDRSKHIKAMHFDKISQDNNNPTHLTILKKTAIDYILNQ